jgi:hypothetical protein
MAEDKVIIDESVEDFNSVAENLLLIAQNMETTIQTAIQKGYDAAVGKLQGSSGTIEIDIATIQPQSITYSLEGVDVKENDIVIFSPKTMADRDYINQIGLFISPTVKFVGKVPTITLESKGQIGDTTEKTTIDLTYLVVRGRVSAGEHVGEGG